MSKCECVTKLDWSGTGVGTGIFGWAGGCWWSGGYEICRMVKLDLMNHGRRAMVGSCLQHFVVIKSFLGVFQSVGPWGA